MVSISVALKAERTSCTYSTMPALRCGILIFLSVYLVLVLSQANLQEGEVYTSPEGLQMTVSAPFPSGFMRIHYWGGVLLIPLTVYQKHLTFTMGNVGVAGSRSSKKARLIHRYLGYVVTFLVGFMAFGGYSLRTNSTFEGFQFAMILFVAPWLVFILLVPLSGYLGWGVTHVVSGEALFKACIAVPLARCLGVALQRYTHMSMSEGYYIGILLSSVIIGIWALYDLFLLLRKIAEKVSERNK